MIRDVPLLICVALMVGAGLALMIFGLLLRSMDRAMTPPEGGLEDDDDITPVRCGNVVKLADRRSA